MPSPDGMGPSGEQGFLDRADEMADHLREASHVKVVSHIDADGLCSAAVASRMLDRAGLSYEVSFCKQLDRDVLRSLRDRDPGLVLFTDFGSGQTAHMEGLEAMIVDHHKPAPDEAPRPKWHLNPHLFGLDGAKTASGAGVAYFLARAMDPDNRDLARIAVVGAVGDLQDSNARRLTGLNERIVADAQDAGVVRVVQDARLYGRETRPVFKMLQYADDPRIPGASGSFQGATALLKQADVPLKEGDTWRRWVDLSRDEKRRVLSLAARRILREGESPDQVDRLVGEVYVLTGEEPGTPLRNAKEFATLLNSTARYERAQVGLAVARGDRGEALEAAMSLLNGHRRNLVDSVQAVQDEVRDHGILQVFHAGDRIRETVVGIVCGMLYQNGLDRDRPVVGFARSDPGKVKVSSRGNRSLVGRGLNLGEAMAQAAGSVGGEGGGHDVAAGATIPAGKEKTFLEAVDGIVRGQLG